MVRDDPPPAVPAAGAETPTPAERPAEADAVARSEVICGPPPPAALAHPPPWYVRGLLGIVGFSISLGVLIFVLYILERLREA